MFYYLLPEVHRIRQCNFIGFLIFRHPSCCVCINLCRHSGCLFGRKWCFVFYSECHAFSNLLSYCFSELSWRRMYIQFILRCRKCCSRKFDCSIYSSLLTVPDSDRHTFADRSTYFIPEYLWWRIDFQCAPRSCKCPWCKIHCRINC